MTTRIVLRDLQGVPQHLVPTVAAAFAAGFEVSLWMVRELTVVHTHNGPHGWMIFQPDSNSADAMALHAVIAMKYRDASLSTRGDYATVEYRRDIRTRYSANSRMYHGDMRAAIRGAIVCAAHKLYKVTQNESIDCDA